MSILSAPRLFSSLASIALVAFIAPNETQAQCLDWQPGFHIAGMDSEVNAMTVYDDGQGPAVFAAGLFTRAGPTFANRIARWNGSTWSTLGSGISGNVSVNEPAEVYPISTSAVTSNAQAD